MKLRKLRQACKDSLITFARAVRPNYKVSRVHRLLAAQLEDAYSRGITRLALSMPPRHGKSELCSVIFPAWCFTKKRDQEIIQSAYSAELSEEFSGKTKALLRSKRYRRLFGDVIDPGSNRIKIWKTKSNDEKQGRGTYFATGIGGGGVGRGADIYIVDDPIKSREEANSKNNRDKVWNWYLSSALTRLSPGGVMIVIHTRWHEDDLIGRLTNPVRVREMAELGFGHENFHVINLEAICENPDTDPLGRKMGEALWPERWSGQTLMARKRILGSYEFTAQYQGRPAALGGNLVDVRNIKRIKRHQVPDSIELVRGWDLALSKTSMADYSCGAYGGCDKEGNFYLVHMDRDKRRWPEQKQVIISYAMREADGGRIGIEVVSAWRVAYEELAKDKALRGRTIVKSYEPDKDKVARALPWFAKIDGGMFYMVDGTWNQDFLDELTHFPNGAHDDQIDSITVLWEMTHKKQTLVIA